MDESKKWDKYKLYNFPSYKKITAPSIKQSRCCYFLINKKITKKLFIKKNFFSDLFEDFSFLN